MVKIKALKNWPPQEWRSEAQTLAPENALDAANVSASVEVNQPGALLSLPPQFAATKVALTISGASPNKPLREIGELEIDSELSQ